VADQITEDVPDAVMYEATQQASLGEGMAYVWRTARTPLLAELAEAKRDLHILTTTDDAQVAFAEVERDQARAELDAARAEIAQLKRIGTPEWEAEQEDAQAETDAQRDPETADDYR
jgi:hypothetical protein